MHCLRALCGTLFGLGVRGPLDTHSDSAIKFQSPRGDSGFICSSLVIEALEEDYEDFTDLS